MKLNHYRKKQKTMSYEQFLDERFVKCECGYNNEKKRFENYGTCLRCGKILDKKIYLARLLKIKNKGCKNGK